MATATERLFPASPTTGRTPAALAAPWLFTGEDNLRLVIINSQPGVVVTLDGRRLGPTDLSPQPFTQTFTPSGDRAPNTFDFGFGDGFLLNCSLIVTTGSPLVGQTYCMLQVIRGLTGSTLVLGCLLGGYITAMQHLAYPGSPIKSSTEDEPFVRSVIGTTPAAGANINELVPTGARWELLILRIVLATSAAPGARVPAALIRDAANNALAIGVPGLNATASNAWFYTYGQNLPVQTTVTSANQPIPERLILPAGAKIQTNTTGLDAGDQFSAPTMLVREWLEAA